MNFLTDADELEAAVGSRQLPPMLKSIDFLDEHCTTLLARSPLAVVGYVDREGERRAGAFGGRRGFATVRARTQLSLPDVAGAPGTSIATMFLIPGWREALRINGRLDANDPSTLVVEEAFVHCGKAILRSKLWEGADTAAIAPGSTGGPPLDAEARGFLAACPFVVMTSQDAAGNADASPKGDPPGFIAVLDDATIAIPDRRGNRRTDTFHNLVEDPRAAFLAIAPGDDRVLELRGTARVTDDAALRERMAVQGKTPQAALVVAVETCDLTRSSAITSARLWDATSYEALDDLPKAGQIWTDHIKANRTGGLKAAAVRAVANGKIVQAGTESEYKRKLY